MAEIDYTLKVKELLKILCFEDKPTSKRQLVSESAILEDMSTHLARVFVHARDIAELLSELGVEAFPYMLKETDGANQYQLIALIRTMGQLGAEMSLKQNPNPAAELVSFLDHAVPDVQLHTIHALELIADPTVLDQIEPLAHSNDEEVRKSATHALSTMSVDYPKRICYLRRSLSEGDDSALRTLLAKPEKQIPWDDLFELLESPSDKICELLLGQFARRQISSVPYETLIRLCRDASPAAKAHAIGILAKNHPKDETETLEVMFEALQHDDKKVAKPASKWLKNRSKKIQQRLPPLLTSKASLTKQLALELLEGPLAGELIGVVGKILNSRSNMQVRVAAVRVLNANPQIEQAREFIHDALTDSTHRVRESALRALQVSAVDQDIDRLSNNFESLSGALGRLNQTIALLGHISSPRATELLCANANHPEVSVQRLVQKILQTKDLDNRPVQVKVPIDNKTRNPTGEPDVNINILDDQSMDAETVVSHWSTHPQEMQAALRDFCHPGWATFMRKLLKAGWKPKTDIEHAAVIVSQPGSDWSQFPESAIPTLQPVFENPAHKDFQAVIAPALECWPSACKPLVVGRLRKCSNEHAREDAQRRGLESLTAQQQLLSKKELADWLQNISEPALRLSAVRIVGHLEDSEFADALVFMFNDPSIKENAPLHSAIIAALGNLGDARVVGLSADLINNHGNNPDWSHGYAVIPALQMIANGEALRLLQFVLRRAPDGLRQQAASALEKLNWQAKSDEDRARMLLHSGDLETLQSLGADALPIISSAVRNAQKVRLEWVQYLLQFDSIEVVRTLASAHP